MPALNQGVPAALGAALLFGASTPLAKMMLGEISPWLLAGLLYLGSGIGLALGRALKSADHAGLAPGEARWLAGAVLTGGVLGPVLLMWGLSGMPASGAALLLNAEAVFTALIAWFVFRENFDRRIALGFALIVAGVLVLTWPAEAGFGAALPALAVIAACLAWGIDNNLTRRVALADARYVAMVKGIAAGTTNTGLALLLGARLPELSLVGMAGALGFVGYGLSLVLFVHALRDLGTARAAAYFSTAPFAGAVLGLVLLREPVSFGLGIAAALMAWGVWLHLTERHEHPHAHPTMEHSHEHEHDEHHRHSHAGPAAPGVRHTHHHRHEGLRHSHPHYPDSHHRHDH